MKAICTILCCLLFKYPVFPQSGFELIYGSPYEERAYSLVQGDDGNFTISGITRNFLAGTDLDFWVIHTDPSGGILWENKYGGPEAEFGGRLVQTSDKKFAVLGTTFSYGAGISDAYLLLLDGEGNELWQKTYGGPELENGGAILQDNRGDFVLVCRTSSYGNGSYDIFIIKTDNQGDTIWTRTFGESSIDVAYDLVEEPGLGYMIVGTITNDSTFASIGYVLRLGYSGDVRSQWFFIDTLDSLNGRIFGAVALGQDGHIYLGEWGNNCVFYKVNQNGNVLWERTGFCSRSVTMTTDGGIVAVGYEEDHSDWITLRKFSSSGTVLWSRTFQRYRDNTAFDVIETNDGGLAFVGDVYGDTPNGSFDFYFVKTDCEGNVEFTSEGCIPEDPEPVLQLYPTVTSEFITLEIVGLEGIEKIELELFDTQGRLVRRFSGMIEGENRIDVHDLSHGLYYYRVMSLDKPLKAGRIILC